MPRARRASRVDANQQQIVDTLRRCGALVLSLAPIGQDVCDLLVRFRGRYILLEVKTKDGCLSDGQREWLERWGGSVVRSDTEALKVIGALRS